MWYYKRYIAWLSPQVTLDNATDDWGIKVERVEIKDVKLPPQLLRAMASEAEATREARAKVRRFYISISLSKHKSFKGNVFEDHLRDEMLQISSNWI